MPVRCLVAAIVIGLTLTSGGCKPKSRSTITTADPTTSSPSLPSKTAKPTSLPPGWKVYSPPEGDFSVTVPGDPIVIRNRDEKTQKVRVYGFQKGDAKLTILVFTDRKAEAMKLDTIDEARQAPGLIAGSIREISLGDLKGLELRRLDPMQGEMVIQSLTTPNGSRAVALWMAKPNTLSESETRAFLDSFRFSK